ncbi:hypothetical protein [Teredinibacter sp. KSP-S5-2]|uniref:hypothetical protein n=1 Tax=Teredinibacter sp. KSP-S5-2 TaxID=3034506 RepID=UPI002934CDC4|nr:hypothetical protein [Teredinibacter sp. KSP-S5-2]WNO10061.1 hypothetical protein P5V12_02635 [Teredinibacter sp. KSP-S5-2]
MKLLLVIATLLFSSYVIACGNRSVPIKLEVKRGYSGQIYISFKAPLNYEEFYLLGAQYNNGENMIPMYKGYQEDDRHAYYEVNGEDDFFKDAEITISYAVKGTLCFHSEKYIWEQILKACKNCKKA